MTTPSPMNQDQIATLKTSLVEALATVAAMAGHNPDADAAVQAHLAEAAMAARTITDNDKDRWVFVADHAAELAMRFAAAAQQLRQTQATPDA